jgi:hypothetical protein
VFPSDVNGDGKADIAVYQTVDRNLISVAVKRGILGVAIRDKFGCAGAEFVCTVTAV